jgi:nucleoporin NUP42
VTTLSKDDGKTSFHVYQNAANNGAPEHLWFPTGPPPAKSDTQLAEEDVFYSGQLGKELQAIYEAVATGQGAFVGGVMPEVPPRREWVRFDI